jgi:hypothetical protein
MRIEYLSDHARDQLGIAQQQVATSAADEAACRRLHARAVNDVKTARRGRPLWKRILALPSGDERDARGRVMQAEQAIRQTTQDLGRGHHRVQQQAAGVQGEDALTWNLARLTDEWVMLRGYQNRRGEADHLLVGPLGVWAIEVKRRAVRVHIVGDQWAYEKLDRWGNVVETGLATDRSGRSWAHQVTDVADDLAAWLRKNGHPVAVRTAVMLMHERAQIGRHEQLTVDLVANDADHLLAALSAPGRVTALSPQECGAIVRLIERDHRFHHQRRRRR